MTMEQTSAWARLENLATETRNDRIEHYFSADTDRFAKMSLRFEELFLDYSKNKVSDVTLEALLQLAKDSALAERREQMFSGGIINVTEKRPVLHTALRYKGEAPALADGRDVMPDIRAALAKLRTFTDQVRNGQWRGYMGQRIKDVVNIGIGGSDLGPAMVCDALDDYRHADINLHFISSVDGQPIRRLLNRLDPETTLFIVSTKTFSTQETLINASTAKRWFLEHVQGDESCMARHFVAATANKSAAESFGIQADSIFEFWDWVGGRYSLWSSIGLPIALCIGYDRFNSLLDGAFAMDRHFFEAPYRENMPVILALIGIWHTNFQEAATQAIIPYNQALHKLPALLQQLDMESNGKSVDVEGNPVNHATGPIVWGQTGSNGQHAFFQLLHQGKHLVPIDFIASLKPPAQDSAHHAALLTNMLAQARAFMTGDDQGNRESYASCPGNRPSNTLLMEELTPRNLGALIALYEHKVFVQGVIWNINSFDQWGVQLGKRLATDISQSMNSQDAAFDGSTEGLMTLVQQQLAADNHTATTEQN